MKTGITTYSDRIPDRFVVIDLKDYKVITVCENPQEVLTSAIDGENNIQIRYNMYTDKFYGETYEELVSAFVGLKYSTGDEIALMRKAMQGTDSIEVDEYLKFVEDVKGFAKGNT